MNIQPPKCMFHRLCLFYFWIFEFWILDLGFLDFGTWIFVYIYIYIYILTPSPQLDLSNYSFQKWRRRPLGPAQGRGPGAAIFEMNNCGFPSVVRLPIYIYIYIYINIYTKIFIDLRIFSIIYVFLYKISDFIGLNRQIQPFRFDLH